MPLPILWEHYDLSFVALQTGKALNAEGAAMHHCVATASRQRNHRAPAGIILWELKRTKER